jgi:hypothetical protein
MMEPVRRSHGRGVGTGLACALLVVIAASCGGGDESDASEVTAAPSQDAVADATAFWEAVVAGDRATALAYIGPPPEGEEPERLFGRAHNMESQFDWYQAVGWRWTLEGCTADDAGPEYAECDVTAQNAWTEAMGLDPFPSTLVFRFDDDGHVREISGGAGGDRFVDDWLARGWGPFRAWVEENYPEDLEVMTADDVLSAEALELYEINTERFVTAQGDGTGAEPGEISAIQEELMTPGPGRVPVDFAIDAPDAQRVTLEMAANFWADDPRQTIELFRVDDDRGSHAVTLYLGNDQWQYRFRIDGMPTPDPANPLRVADADGQENSILVVGETLPWVSEQPDVATGAVREHVLPAGVLGEEQTVTVYTPPGYTDQQRYPLLVLLHGYGMQASSWVELAGVDHAMDNLIAAGEIGPFVVAMPNTAWSEYTDAYPEHVLDEVLPYLDANYSLDPVTGSIAVGGFSMGGHGTLQLAYLRPDRFGLAMPIAMAAPWCGRSCDDVDQFESQ